MDDQWWRGFVSGVAVSVAANLALWAIKGGLSAFYARVLRPPLYGLTHYGRRDCGHRSVGYAYDPRTEKTECLTCYRAHTGAGTAAP
jgi:hypothetical protein